MKQKLFLLLTAAMLSLLPFSAHAANVITLTTSKAVGETIGLYIEASGTVTLTGVSEAYTAGIKSYTLTGQTVTITGDVTTLGCNNGRLTTLDVSHNTALTYLDCGGNQLTALDVSHNTALLSLDCTNSQLTALDVSHNTALLVLGCSNNQLTALDVTKNTALTQLWCSDNPLTKLDVTKNTALTFLYCYNNQLTALDVSKNTALTELQCYGNQLTALDVSKNTALTQLWCDGNQLTALDVSKNTALTELRCYDNQLTALDVSKNTALTELRCYDNKLRGTAMDALIASLADRTSKTAGKFVVTAYDENAANGNVCTSAQVTAANLKNWTSYFHNNDGTLDELTGTVPTNGVITLTTSKAVGETIGLSITAGGAVTLTGVSGAYTAGDQNYTLTGQTVTITGDVTTLSCDEDNLTALDVTKNTALTTLRCNNNQLTALDVTKNTALTTLWCNNNQLTALDVTKNTALTTLRCNNNQLTTLDVTKNTALTQLLCYNNQLTALDVTKSTALTQLQCYGNRLTTLVSKSTALTKLYCYGNQLTTLDVSQSTALTFLDCDGNQLTTLDVSQNTALTQLWCFDNQLTALDVSQNTALTQLECYGNQFKGTAMDALIASMVDRTGSEAGKFNSNSSSQNLCTQAQVVAIMDKNWRCYDKGIEIVVKDIEMTTSKTVGETMTLNIQANGAVTLTGVIGAYTAGTKSYTLTSKYVELTGNVSELDCSGSSLTSLNINKNIFLTKLTCYGNHLRGSAMDVVIASLADRTGSKAGTLVVAAMNETDANRNVCTPAQVVAAKAKNWNCYTYNNGTLVDYAGVNVLTLKTKKEAGETIKLNIQASGTVTLTGVSEAYTAGEKTYTLTGQTVTLTGDVTELDCSEDSLFSLDASENCILTKLTCYGNKIQGTAIDAMIASLVDRTGSAPGTFVVASDKEANACSSEQLTIATAKNWKCLSHNSDGSTTDCNVGTVKIITLTTSKTAGETIKLNIQASGGVTLAGVNEAYEYGVKTYTLTGQKVVIVGDVPRLDCYGNQLTTLDVTKNTALDYLWCSDNQLTALDVTKNTALDYLDCYGNKLSALDVSQNTALTGLVCFNNELTALDVSKSTALTKLWCYGNQLTALDVTKNTALLSLGCSDNRLTKLDVSQNTALTGLACSDNQLTKLDVTKNTALISLLCYNNQLTTLDVSKNTALTELRCYGNKLRGSSMDALIASLPDRTSTTPGTFVVASTEETAANRNCCTPEQVAAAVAKNWNCYSYDNGNVVYAGANNVITLTTAKAAGSQITLNITASGTVAIAGVSEAYTAGEKTYTLTGQTVTLTGNVTELTCAGNSLSSIDVSKNLLLTELRCQNNNLSQLDLSSNTWLDVLYCYGNRIGGKKMDALIASLPDQSSSALGAVLRAVDKDNAYEGNTFTVPNVNAANEKKWIVRTASGSSLGLTEGVAYLTTSAAVGETMDLYVESTNSLTYDGLIFDNDEGQYPTYDITSQDIYLLGNITILYCDDSPTTKLDVSNVVTLQHLSCRNTSITSLDVTKNTALLSLNYGGTGIHTPVDVSQNTNLQTLSCQGDELTTLDVSKNTKLTTLYCDGNQLQSLDVTKNTRLQTLQCYGNHLQGAQMDALIASLVDRTGTTAGKIIVACDDETDANRNVCTTAQVAAAKAKNWSCYISDTYGNLSDYAGSEPTGISNVQTDDTGDVPAAIYDLSGRRIQQMRHGVNIVRMSNGRTRKVIK